MINFSLLSLSIMELEKETALNLCRDFAHQNPTKEERDLFIEAAKEGIEGVVAKYQNQVYNIGELIYARNLLSEIMEIIQS